MDARSLRAMVRGWRRRYRRRWSLQADAAVRRRMDRAVAAQLYRRLHSRRCCQPGSSTGDTATITVTSTGGFSGAVNLACAVTQVPGAIAPTCTLSNASASISGTTTTQTTTLTVVTIADGSAANQPRSLFWPGAGGAALALMFLFIPRRRRNLLLMVGLLAVIVSAAGLGCSAPQKKGSTGTTPGSYAVTVTGMAGAITETATVNVTVN
jgi:trimeric autotransporter adhesin